MHVHLSLELDDAMKMNMVTSGVAISALKAANNAKITLLSGYTTVRNIGVYLPTSDAFSVDVALNKAIKQDLVPGPRIVPAGHFISSTGGHGDITGFAPSVRELDYRSGIADGVEELQKAVRYQIKYGAKVIKFMATGGVISEEGGVPQSPQFSAEEMKVICDTAHRVGIKCAAHAETEPGVHLAIRAGVDTLEHGFQLTREDIHLMLEKQVYLIPTALTASLSELYIPFNQMPDNIRDKGLLQQASAIESLKKAIKAGVKIASGSDAGISQHGKNAKELYYYVKYGMSTLTAIQSATIHAADALGDYALDGAKVGQIKPSYEADIIAVSGNPLRDIKALQETVFVMKAGRIYKNLTAVDVKHLKGEQNNETE